MSVIQTRGEAGGGVAAHLQCPHCGHFSKSHAHQLSHVAASHPSCLDDVAVGRLGNILMYQSTARLFHCSSCFYTSRDFTKLYKHIITKHCMDETEGGGGEGGDDGSEVREREKTTGEKGEQEGEKESLKRKGSSEAEEEGKEEEKENLTGKRSSEVEEEKGGEKEYLTGKRSSETEEEEKESLKRKRSSEAEKEEEEGEKENFTGKKSSETEEKESHKRKRSSEAEEEEKGGEMENFTGKKSSETEEEKESLKRKRSSEAEEEEKEGEMENFTGKKSSETEEKKGEKEGLTGKRSSEPVEDYWEGNDEDGAPQRPESEIPEGEGGESVLVFDSGGYRCLICGWKNKMKNLGINHVVRKHDIPRPYASQAVKRDAATPKQMQSGAAEEDEMAGLSGDMLKEEMEAMAKVIRFISSRFVCLICGWKTKLKGFAISHVVRSHDVERPYGCKDCKHSFFLPSCLQQHVRAAHRPGRYACPFCCFRSHFLGGFRRHCSRCNARGEEEEGGRGGGEGRGGGGGGRGEEENEENEEERKETRAERKRRRTEKVIEEEEEEDE